MFEYSIALPLLLLSLIHNSHTLCLSTTQLDGLCTSCPLGKTLLAGYCVSPITGCTNQLSPRFCGNCALGFTLANMLCVPVGSGVGNGASQNALSVLETYSDHGPNDRYQLLDFYWKKKYASQLQDKISNLSMVYELKTTYGYVYTLTYMNPFADSTIYRAEGMVDFFYAITEYSFATVTKSAMNDYTTLLWSLDRKATVRNMTVLKSVALNEVQQLSGNDYRYFYIGSLGSLYVCDLQRTTNSSSNLAFPALTELAYQYSQSTVINYVLSLFPELQLLSSYTASHYTVSSSDSIRQFYKYIFDSQVVVIVEVQNNSLKLYSYEEPDNLLPLQGTGGYLPFVNLQDSEYLSVLAFLRTKYPALKDKQVESVRYQVVSGINYMVEFNCHPFSQDIYLAVVFKGLGGAAPVTVSLHKNGVDISNNPANSLAVPGSFNYQTDTVFHNTYQVFRQLVKAQISCLLPILSVQYVVQPNSVIDYLVIFTPIEYAYLRYDPNAQNKYIVTSFTAFGTTIPIPSSAMPTPSANRAALIAFLQGARPTLFSSESVLVRWEAQLDPDTTGYEVDILTSSGVYFTRIHQKHVLYLEKIAQISNSKCADLASSEFIDNPIVASLNTFILQNYAQTAGHLLVLVQAYISATAAVSYRMLYRMGDSRVQIQVVQSMGLYLISKVSTMSGVGCDIFGVLAGGVCKKACTAFAF